MPDVVAVMPFRLVLPQSPQPEPPPSAPFVASVWLLPVEPEQEPSE